MPEPIGALEKTQAYETEFLNEASAPLLNEFLKSGVSGPKRLDSPESRKQDDPINQNERVLSQSDLIKTLGEPSFTHPIKLGVLSMALPLGRESVWTKRLTGVPAADVGIYQTAQDLMTMQANGNYRKYSLCLAADSALTLSALAMLSEKIPVRFRAPIFVGSAISRAFLEQLD
ncbi:MAG: hypothetical protein K2X27_15060 [Candidatus Obscuribacterales bacterium]|nr:hypothetical protein [Candidatus Obscuribacterales bacterium]